MKNIGIILLAVLITSSSSLNGQKTLTFDKEVRKNTYIEDNAEILNSTNVQPKSECSSASLIKSNLNNDVYHPFLNNSKWFTVNNSYEGYINRFSYLSGDTIINNLLYSKLKYKFIKLPNLFNYIYATYNKTYLYDHYFREDVDNKKVYILSWGKYEDLFYDFNLNVGDKLSSATSFTLSEIDTIEIKGEDRKKFTFKTVSGENIIWIEGIGNISDPLSPTAIFQPYSKLYCAYQNDSLIYDNCYLPDINCYDYSNVETGLNNTDIYGCNIYPNPTTGKFTVTVNGDALNTIKLYDMNGTLLRVFECNLTENSVSLDISNLLAGVYYCVIETQHAFGTYKIIKC